jgi:membrane protein
MYAVFAESLKAWFAQRAASKGAALAFYTLFSMTPILVLAVVIAGYFFGEEAARGQINAQIQGLIGPNGAKAIEALLASSSDPASGLIAVITASVLMVAGATSVFVELKGSLDDLWGVADTRDSGLRAFFMVELRSLLLVFLLAMLLVAILLAGAALAVLERQPGGAWIKAAVALSPVAGLLTFGVIACLFAAVYKLLPAVPLSWRDVAVGALFTAGLFSLGNYAVGYYLSHSAVASGFGAAGSLIALLLWIYYSAQIFFLGAEFTHQYALRLGSLKSGVG